MAFDINVKILGSAGVIAVLTWAIVTMFLEAARLGSRSLGIMGFLMFCVLCFIILVDADITYRKIR